MHTKLQNTAYYLQVVFLALVIGIGLQIASAWTPPNSAPPTQTVTAPITTSNVTQSKPGTLGVENLNASVLVQAAALRLTTGAGAGKVLTSDASGNATWQDGTGGAGLVKYGGGYLTGGGRNNVGLVAPCYVKNIVTNACSCPTGYTARLSSYGAYYWWSQWDNYNWAYVCESL
jgi:hypothetical protein